jgi:hypothetical protein
MPVLHTYRNKEGHYILAGVNGKIITYRLSNEGAHQLIENGINKGVKFPWSILLELIRQGDAYTGHSGVDPDDVSGWSQLGFTFDILEHEPTQDEPVPLCACGSMEGLHITEAGDTKTASLLCNECRKTRRDQIDASVPVYMINTPSALDHLLERSGLMPEASVMKYRELLNMNLAAKWQSKRLPKVKAVQAGLFGEPEKAQQSLL